MVQGQTEEENLGVEEEMLEGPVKVNFEDVLVDAEAPLWNNYLAINMYKSYGQLSDAQALILSLLEEDPKLSQIEPFCSPTPKGLQDGNDLIGELLNESISSLQDLTIKAPLPPSQPLLRRGAEVRISVERKPSEDSDTTRNEAKVPESRWKPILPSTDPTNKTPIPSIRKVSSTLSLPEVRPLENASDDEEEVSVFRIHRERTNAEDEDFENIKTLSLSKGIG